MTHRFSRFGLSATIVSILLFFFSPKTYGETVGGCDTYTPTEGQTVKCEVGLPKANSGIQSSTDTANNNVTVTIANGVILDINGSTIGLGSGSTVTNDGVLNTQSFFNGYGISSGANNRSTAGGNTFTNNGTITTGGGNSVGMYIDARRTTALGNTITNTGSITTSGSNSEGIRLLTTTTRSEINLVSNDSTGTINTNGSASHGIRVQNATGFIDITNNGVITVTGSGAHGIYSQGAVNLVVGGTISASNGDAIHLAGGSGFAAGANTVTLKAGAVLVGGLVFDANKTSEKIIFDGFVNSNFNNAITGLNNIDVVNGANVTMSASTYEFGVSQINVASGLNLTISGQIVGSTSIIKVGDGTLTFSGANTYTGDTTISAGTLIATAVNRLSAQSAVSVASGALLDLNKFSQVVGSLAGSGTVDLGAATLTTGGNDRDTTFSGTINGSGGLTKQGSGLFVLSGTNSYTGATLIDNGTLAFTSAVTSNVTINSDGTLAGSGPITGTVINAGTIQPNLDGNRSNLTINGDYIGNNGFFVPTLTGSMSNIQSDRLIIDGATYKASGTTTISILDPIGLLGKPIEGQGVLLVDLSSNNDTHSTAFQPARIAAGAYEYTVVQDPDKNWYLRSISDEPPPVPVTPEPIQRDEVAFYPALPTLARQYLWNINGSLDERRGGMDLLQAQQMSDHGLVWGRVIAQDQDFLTGNVNDGPSLKATNFALQFGRDLYPELEDTDTSWRIGPMLTLGKTYATVYNATGEEQTGSMRLHAVSLGVNATMTTATGGYLDLLLQGTRLSRATATSRLNTQIKTNGLALSGSIEAGRHFALSETITFTPQFQLYGASIKLESAEDAYSLIEMDRQELLVGRVGAKLAYNHRGRSDSHTQFWARISGLSTLSGENATTTFLNVAGTNPTSFNSKAPSSWASLQTGFSQKISDHSSLAMTLGYQTSFDDRIKGMDGQINLRYNF